MTYNLSLTFEISSSAQNHLTTERGPLVNVSVPLCNEFIPSMNKIEFNVFDPHFNNTYFMYHTNHLVCNVILISSNHISGDNFGNIRSPE